MRFQNPAHTAFTVQRIKADGTVDTQVVAGKDAALKVHADFKAMGDTLVAQWKLGVPASKFDWQDVFINHAAM